MPESTTNTCILSPKEGLNTGDNFSNSNFIQKPKRSTSHTQSESKKSYSTSLARDIDYLVLVGEAVETGGRAFGVS